jgi:acetyltransferase-like isoleucine patch superfamily enzyme
MTNFFIHPSAICESRQIGSETRIWAFVHVLGGAIIGDQCNICDNVFIENDVIIGNRVTIKSGVQLWDGIRIEDDVFIGPNATFTNDLFPRSMNWKTPKPITILRKGASVGANSTILAGVTVGENAMIGAGSVVTKSVQANTIVFGNPAKFIRYITDKE